MRLDEGSCCTGPFVGGILGSAHSGGLDQMRPPRLLQRNQIAAAAMTNLLSHYQSARRPLFLLTVAIGGTRDQTFLAARSEHQTALLPG